MLTQPFDFLARMVQSRRQGRKLLVLLDYDGTLVEIAPRPELARPPQELIQVLGRLASLPGLALVVVSGRSLDNLRELLPIGGLNYLGSHGAEGLIGGEPWTLNLDAGSSKEQEELQRQLVSRLAGMSGWWLENKPLGFALHYRQAKPEEEVSIFKVLGPWLEKVRHSGQHQILEGKKVVEILPQGVSKGAAILEILQLPGFSQHFPVYLGDDVTDESAFQALQGRGLTVKVGVGQAVTSASYSLSYPAEVRQFLAFLATRLEDRR